MSIEGVGIGVGLILCSVAVGLLSRHDTLSNIPSYLVVVLGTAYGLLIVLQESGIAF